MAWCKLEDTFCEDPKWDLLAEELDTHRRDAAGLVAFLWSWCVTHAPDGHLPGSARTIARAAQWGGDHGELVHALLHVGVIDKTKDGYEVHGFAQRAESFIRAKRVQKQRHNRVLRHSAVTDNAQKISRGEIVKLNDPSERRGEEKRREEIRGDQIQIQDPDLLTQAPKNRAALEEFAEQVTGWTTPTAIQVALFTEPQPAKKPPKPKAENGYTPVHQVRLRYEALWASKFGKPYDGWSPKHASRAKALCASPAALTETFRLLELFFEWRDPRVASSYSFCEGPFSFVMQRDALRARLAKPELDRAIGALGATQRQLSNEDAEKLRYEEEMKTLRKGWDSIKTPEASPGIASKSTQLALKA